MEEPARPHHIPHISRRIVMPDIDAATQVELEAAAFRRLRDHLRERTDVQNIGMLNLAGF